MTKVVTGSKLRKAAALLLLILAIAVFAPTFFLTSTTNAVLTGRTIVLRAPVDGRVTPQGAQLPIPGEPVAKGDPIAFVVAGETPDQRWQDEADRQALANDITRLASINAELASIRDVRANLLSQKKIWSDALVARAEQRRQAAQETASAAQKAALIAQLEADKLAKTASVGAIDKIEADRAKARAIEAAAKAGDLQAEATRASIEAASAHDGVNVLDGQNDVSYSEQKLHDLTLEEATIGGEANGLVAKIADERNRIASTNQYPVIIPASAVVWRQLVAAGSDVVKGQEIVDLIDCNDLYILAHMPEEDTKDILIGTKVGVKIAGREGHITGTIRTIRGWTREQSTDSSATTVGDDHLSELEIGVDINDLRKGDDNFCGVGSGVEISITKDYGVLRKLVQSWIH